MNMNKNFGEKMNVKNILLIILILANIGLIISTSSFIYRIDKLESRLDLVEKELRNPELKIIPTK